MQTIDERVMLLVNLARAYYEQGMTQEEIARTLPISRSQVSRYLSEAREMGIVQFRVIDPAQRSDDLSAALMQRFPSLKAAIVVPVFTTNEQVARQMVGLACASYLREIVHPGQCLAIGCGRTVRGAIEALKICPVPNLSVVQAMGNLGHEALNIDFNALTRAAADAFTAHAYYINAPAILGSGTAAEWEGANPSIHESLERAREADIYLFTVGALDRDELYTRTGLISQGDIQWLRDRGVAGDICAHFFDVQGRECDTPFANRIIGITLNDLKRAELSIGIVGGVGKALPFRAALTGGWINIAITDEHTARAVLEIEAGS
jgi:deoxyribonucleoside regulator